MNIKTYLAKNVPGDLVVLSIVGSTAYGLATEGSDIDRLGIFLADSRDYLRLDNVKESYVSTDPDITMHELGKFCRLALKCNPTLMELLYIEPELRTEVYDELRMHRAAFLSTKHVRNAYSGYAFQQFDRLQKRHAEGKDGFNSDLRKRTAKHARHCYRLLLQGNELLTTGEINVDVSSRREEIFEFGELAQTDMDAFTERYTALYIALIPDAVSVLPDKPDVETINKIVVDARIRNLTN